MGKSNIIYYLLACLFLSGGCIQKEATNHHSQHKTNWQTVLQDKLPLLGHRNWIVITDMAYPLQTREGITTLYANEPYTERWWITLCMCMPISIRTKNYLVWKKVFARG